MLWSAHAQMCCPMAWWRCLRTCRWMPLCPHGCRRHLLRPCRAPPRWHPLALGRARACFQAACSPAGLIPMATCGSSPLLPQGSANTEARPDGPPPGRSDSQPRQQRQSQNGAGPRQQGQIAANAPASLPEGAIGDAAAARQSGGRGRGKPRSGRGRGRGSNSNGGSDQQRGRAPASQPPGPLASATT
eukprot:jgi/Astpho2/4030/Aster-01187